MSAERLEAWVCRQNKPYNFGCRWRWWIGPVNAWGLHSDYAWTRRGAIWAARRMVRKMQRRVLYHEPEPVRLDDVVGAPQGNPE